MPCICEFFGIAVYMYHNDHWPAHFHAEYAGREARYEIDTLRVNKGRLHRRAHSLVIEWADIHRAELLANWHRARRGEPLMRIEPLD